MFQEAHILTVRQMDGWSDEMRRLKERSEK